MRTKIAFICLAAFFIIFALSFIYILGMDKYASNIDDTGINSSSEVNSSTEINNSSEVNSSTEINAGSSHDITIGEAGNTMTKANGTTFQKRLPVLMYHAVNDKTFGIRQLFVQPSEFDKQMEYLYDNGYTPLQFDDIRSFEKYDKPVIITFDDGYRDNYTNAYPILKKYNFKATIFLTTDFIGKPAYLTEEQIKKMLDVFSFQSHTVTHAEMNKIKDDMIEKECAESKKIIENITGIKVNVLAYPSGMYNQKVMDIASKYYDYAVTIHRGFYTKESSKLEIRRIYIKRSDTIKEFIEKINNPPGIISIFGLN